MKGEREREDGSKEVKVKDDHKGKKITRECKRQVRLQEESEELRVRERRSSRRRRRRREAWGRKSEDERGR